MTRTMAIGKTQEDFKILLDNNQLEQVTDFVYQSPEQSNNGRCRM
jgi:hypothetical protein